MTEKRRKRILTAISLYHACNDGSVVTLPMLFPLLFDQGILIRNYDDIGRLNLVGLVVAFSFQAALGHWARRRHSGYYLAADALITGVSLFLLTLSIDYWMLVVFFVAMRIGTSIYHPVGISWLSHTFGGMNLDKPMGVQSAFGDLGVLISFSTTGLLAQKFGWKIPLFLWGFLNFAAMVVGLFISRRTTSRQEAIEQKEEEKEPVSWIKAFGSLGTFVPMIVLGGLTWGITLNFAPSLMDHGLGLSLSETGVVFGFWIAAGALSSLFYGKITELFGRLRSLILALTIIAGTTFVIGFSRDVSISIAAMTLYGAALFIIYPAILSYLGGRSNPRNRTPTFALSANIMIVANSIFTYLSGRISDLYGIHTPFILIGIITSLVLLYVLMIRSSLKSSLSKG